MRHSYPELKLHPYPWLHRRCHQLETQSLTLSQSHTCLIFQSMVLQLVEPHNKQFS